MDDEQILLLLEQRDERAISELRRKYGSSCRFIAYQLLGNVQDAEEVVSDTLLSAWNAIPPAHPENLSAFLTCLTKRISKNRYKHDHAKKRGGAGERDLILDELADCITSADNVEAEIESRELTASLNRFLEGLPQRSRVIMVQRYNNLHSIQESRMPFRSRKAW